MASRSNDIMSEKSIFLDAIELDDPSARDAFLDDACRDDRSLRQRVQSLLNAHLADDHVVDRPPVSNATDATSIDQHKSLGTMIGPYRLMEQIGEGGFGLVFVAQQEQPVKRRVALKIIKPGTGSQEVIARFEAERQAVAMMDHPNIAQVFDAGVTDDGRPYFVMELVRGLPITDFADRSGMSLRGRLELFIDVCSAVHHAHQKGVIHRDIKPSNVMVTLHDGKPIVKVIDFGVAKAIGQALTDKTIYTRFFSMIGTPLYMSPEQAEMSGLDVDTRSDIYSLGVLMYELLAGTTPFDRERMDSAGLDELRRIIREEEPPRPSRRMTTLGDRMTTVAAARGLDAHRLTSSLRGDLDWIVMKSLEKDRQRRYDSAMAMANDIRCYLSEQPITARPPSLAYQGLKFARRNRAVLATLSMVSIAMLVGIAMSLWQMNQAMIERDQKEKALRDLEQFSRNVTNANSLVASAQTHVNAQRFTEASLDFDLAVTRQPEYDLPWVSRAQFLADRLLWDEAAADYARAIQLSASTDTPQWWGAAALLAWARQDEAQRQLGQDLQNRFDQGGSIRSWEDARNCAFCSNELSKPAMEMLAASCERWLRDTPGPDPFHRAQPGQPNRGLDPLGMDGRGPRPPHRPMEGDGRQRFGPPLGGPRFDRQPRFGESRTFGRRDPPLRPNGRLDLPPLGRSGPEDRRPDDRRPRPLPRPVCLYVTAMVHLRCGHYEAAMDRFMEASLDRGWPMRDMIDAAVAMAHHQAGNHEDAKRWMARSHESIVRIVDDLRYENQQAGRTPWIDYVEALVLHRDAGERIPTDAQADLTAIEQIRARSIERINGGERNVQ